MAKKEYKKNFYSFFLWKNISTKLSAFGLAFLLWLFVLSENEYIISTDIPIEVRNLPAQLVLNEKVPKFAKIRIKGEGRSIFKSFILKRFVPGYKLVLDLESISEEYDFVLNEYYDRYPQKIIIPSNFDISFVEIVHPKSINISLDEFKEKSVKVQSGIIINPSPGFTTVSNPIISPKYINVAGSKNIVENIDFIELGPDTFNNVTSDINYILPLLVPEDQLIEYTPKNISFKQDIQPVSERIISEIPVKISNPDTNMRIFTSPQTVSLTVIGGLDFIANMKPNEIEVSVDFKNWDSNQQLYELDVKVPKDVVDWMDLSPKNIELLVTQINN